jgi:hypothetical protein
MNVQAGGSENIFLNAGQVTKPVATNPSQDKVPRLCPPHILKMTGFKSKYFDKIQYILQKSSAQRITTFTVLKTWKRQVNNFTMQ